MKKLAAMTLLAFLLSAMNAIGAGVPKGYEKLAWGTDFAKVVKAYPKGETMKMGEEVIYKQTAPNKNLQKRQFAFRGGKLYAVSVTFSKDYVNKKGIHKLMEEQVKNYGQGTMDRSNAPHLINYIWESPETKLTFAYAPKKSDMSILMFEQAKKP